MRAADRSTVPFIIVLLLAPGTATAQQPADSTWWPSEWGPEDQRGAANLLTPERVVEAARLIRDGQVYALGRVYENGMPLFGERHFSLTMVGRPSGGPLGANRVVWNEELFTGQIAQIGTQFDGLGHIGTRMGDGVRMYNGFRLSEIHTPYGLSKLGVENAGPFFARGVLLDVARYRGVERLAPDDIVTVADIRGTLEMQGIEIREGDVVLFHTGHGRLWMEDNATYNSANPGPGITALRWLVERGIVMTGSDTWATEAVPGERPDRPFEGHQLLMNQNGIYNIENLDTSKLAADRVYEFAFIFAPLRLAGGTGSPGNPIAVR